eukprot:m.215120 g.215120  ORF g.215120 m.215120 type:complete len:555 (+) comp22199_c1_seq7:1534-3198(+)
MDVKAEQDWEEANKYQHIKRGAIVVPEDKSDFADDKVHFSFRKLWAFTGPGFLMSIAYLDPGNLESDLQAGAVAGYQLLWVLFWSTVGGLFLQLLSARLAVVTGLNLAQMCRQQYSKPVRTAVWLMMELAIVAADIQEVIGSAIAIDILSGGRVPLWAGSVITAVDTFLFLFLEQYGLRKLEAFFAALITTMSITFGYMYVVSAPPQDKVLYGLAVPGCDSDAFEQAIGLVGAIIMPHNLYLHSALVLSRDVDVSSKKKIKEANFYYALEGSIALGVSFLINLFVVAVFANAFFGKKVVMDGGEIDAGDIDLLNAGEALYHRYGVAIKYIWAIGLLAAGQSSTMTGTYAGQFVMEGFIRIRIAPWKRVTLTRAVAMGPTVLVAIFANKNVLNTMNESLNVLQSVQLPFALLPVLHFTSIPGLMSHFVNGKLIQVIGWLLSLTIIGINVYLIFSTVQELPSRWWIDLIVAVLSILYFSFVAYLTFGPLLPMGSMTNMYKSRLDKRANVTQLDTVQSNEDGDETFYGDREDEPLFTNTAAADDVGWTSPTLQRKRG